MNYHFIGIGGIGMSALARILVEKKVYVTGSDIKKSHSLDALREKGAVVQVGHSAKHIPRQATVVYSSGISKSNPEYMAAEALKCPLVHRSELLAELMLGHKGLAVTGTHGKTTVSALLTSVLMSAGCDPSFALGGHVGGVNGRWGHGEYFVAEADESDGSFLNYTPYGAIITNLEPEHMEHYKTQEALEEAFAAFFERVEKAEHLFYCGDDPTLARMATKGTSYGFGEKCVLRITSHKQEGWGSRLEIVYRGIRYSDLTVRLLGKHGALNAAAAFGLALSLGLSEEAVRAGLASFVGVERRCQVRGNVREVLLIDDYAHHPTEVKETLGGIRSAIGERPLVVVFQPHRFTRLRDQLAAFARSFDRADRVVVTDVYAAGEPPIDGVNASRLVQEIGEHSTVAVSYMPYNELVEKLGAALRPHEVCVTMGAGDITHVHDHLAAHLSAHPPKKYRLGLIFGGLSAEHEISLRSARCVGKWLDRELYEVSYFAIDKQGRWIVGEEAERILLEEKVARSPSAQSMLAKEVAAELERCDLFFPVLHGPYGEDGTVQGFLELLRKPYAGPDFRSAAICMDKALTKKLVASEGVPTPAFVSVSYQEWLACEGEWLARVEETLHFPLYVKPVHMGSSVGISRVDAPEQLRAAIDYAFRFDTALIVEEGKEGCRELEFPVAGSNRETIRVPIPGEKLAGGEFVDYEKKYGGQPVQTTVHPELPPETLEVGRALAEQAYRAVGCTGMTRVDFLLDREGNFWLTEMNPIPGLQPLSLFPKTWERDGVSGERLMDRLIISGIHRATQQKRHYNVLA